MLLKLHHSTNDVGFSHAFNQITSLEVLSNLAVPLSDGEWGILQIRN